MSCLACAAGVGGCQAGAASYRTTHFDFPPHTATDNWADRHTFAPCLCAPLRVCAAHAESCICATISSCASCSAYLPARTPRHANQVRVGGVLLWALVDPFDNPLAPLFLCVLHPVCVGGEQVGAGSPRMLMLVRVQLHRTLCSLR
jgi:hypothetical protein